MNNYIIVFQNVNTLLFIVYTCTNQSHKAGGKLEEEVGVAVAVEVV